MQFSALLRNAHFTLRMGQFSIAMNGPILQLRRRNCQAMLFSSNLLTTNRKSRIPKSRIRSKRVFSELASNKSMSNGTDGAVPPSHLRTDLIGSPQKAYPKGVRPLPTRVPKTERKPDHRQKPPKQASDCSKNRVRVL